MPLWRVLICCVLLCLPGRSFAASTVEKSVFDNGLTVLLQPMPTSEVVSIYMYVKTGSATEGEYSGMGISHFIEHMLFKGTAKRAIGSIAKEVKSLGGNINASTTLDYTMFTLDVPKDKFKEGLDIISDMVMNSAFDPEQVEKEREVIHGEMRLYNDRPDRRLSMDVFHNVFIRHPYRHPTIGYRPLFDNITREELYGYYRSRYIPNNMILSIAGGIDSTEIMPLIKATFKDFKQQPYPERNIVPEPPQISERYYEEAYQTPLIRFSLAYQGVSFTDPDLYAMDVLSMALGQGESSRLYVDIYKTKHLVDSIDCSNFTPLDKGVFEIEGRMTKDNLSQVRQAVETIINNVKTSGLSAQELDKTKRQVLSQFIFGNQTSSTLAYRAAADEGTAGDAQFSKHYVEAVKNVTNDDIKRVARRYLVNSALSVTVLKPKNLAAQSQEKAKDALATEIHKTVLDNGLTILLKEDHSVGVVALNAISLGGVRQETDANNGISQLLTDSWTKGTQSKKDVQIAKELERRGASMSGFAGRNTIGLQMQVLADDLGFGIDMLADVIKNPAFTEAALKETKDDMVTAIDARDEDVRNVTNRALLETLYLTHPYRLDMLGTKESLKKITRRDILDYYHQLVVPNNMIISVFGDFDSAVVLAKLKQTFASLKKGKFRANEFTEALPQETREKQIKMDKEQAVLMMAFRAPVMKDKDNWAMDTVNTILGAGLSGRLFVKVRDELGKAYTVGSDYTPGIDAGTMQLFVLTTNDKIDTVKDILVKQLQDLSVNLVSDEELRNAKSYLKGTFKMSLNTPSALGWLSTLNELYGLGYDFHKEHDAHVDAVTKEDVRRVAAQYLDIHKAAIVVTSGNP